MDRFESKYFNTAYLMQQALINLLNKKEYEYISIKEICSQAGVNRSTFYLHYTKQKMIYSKNVSKKLIKDLLTFLLKKINLFLINLIL